MSFVTVCHIGSIILNMVALVFMLLSKMEMKRTFKALEDWRK